MLTRMVGVISSSRFLHDTEPFTGTCVELGTRTRAVAHNIHFAPWQFSAFETNSTAILRQCFLPALFTEINIRPSIKLVPRSRQNSIKFVPWRQKHAPYLPCTVTVIWLACRRVPGLLPDAASGNITSPYCRAVRVNCFHPAYLETVTTNPNS